jgi:hypothetical protein
MTARARAGEGTKFAVQRARGKSWETLFLDADPARGQALFRQAVRAEGRSFIRLIQVDFRPESELGEFDWKLVRLHDPRQGGTAVIPEAPGKRATKGSRRPERVKVPLRLYLLFFLFGAMLFGLGFYFFTSGQALWSSGRNASSPGMVRTIS